jgi:hypothetical protein
MLKKATAAITNWNCRLLKMELSSFAGRFFPSHLSHFSHAVSFYGYPF